MTRRSWDDGQVLATGFPERAATVILSAVAALFLFAASAPPAIGAVSEFPLPTANAAPAGIVAGPDGNVWVAETNASRIARVTPAGVVTEYLLPAGRGPMNLAVSGGLVFFTERDGDRIGRLDPAAGDVQASIVEFIVPGAGSAPTDIVAGSDGNLWFTQTGGAQIGRITSAGVVSEFVAGGVPGGITAGPDGNLWYTLRDSSRVVQMSTAGVVIASHGVPTLQSDPNNLGAITTGPDGALWFAAPGVDQIGRITTAGDQTRFSVPNASGIEELVTGADGALWYTAGRAGKIGRLSTDGVVSEYSLPGLTSGPAGITAGPGGALWFTELFANQVGAITTDTTPDAPALGPVGPPGPPGPAGTNAGLALVAFEVKPRKPKVGKRVKVRYVISASARVSLAVARGKRPAQIVTTADVDDAGVGTLTWGGKLRGKRAKPGRYRLTVTAQRGDESVVSSVRTRLRPR